jgi:hypothetical protein
MIETIKNMIVAIRKLRYNELEMATGLAIRSTDQPATRLHEIRFLTK